MLTIPQVQHPALQSTPMEYFSLIDNLLSAIRVHALTTPNPPKIIWSTSPAWPHHFENGRKWDNDLRTNPRLTQYNGYAIKRFTEEGHSVIHSMTLSEPFANGNGSADKCVPFT